MSYLEIDGIGKSYPDFKLALSLTGEAGEVIMILGPSGSGKSTLLRVIAGLIRPDTGRIRVAGKDITDLPPRRRGVGLMFQDFALFPQFDVAGNLSYGLESQKPRPSRAQVSEKVARLLDRFALSGFGKRRIDGLSGGEKQRVALARAMAVSPALMLLDEPLASLDASLRRELRQELLVLQREMGFTSISVTHDQADALSVADRVVVMRNGGVVQVGSPENLFRKPVSAFVAGFFGDANLLTIGQLTRTCPGFRSEAAETLFFSRAEDVLIVTSENQAVRGIEAGLLEFKVVVSSAEYQGRDYLIRGRVVSTVTDPLDLSFRAQSRPAIGELVGLAIRRSKLWPIIDDRA